MSESIQDLIRRCKNEPVEFVGEFMAMQGIIKQLRVENQELDVKLKHNNEIIKTILPFMKDGTYQKEHLLKLINN